MLAQPDSVFSIVGLECSGSSQFKLIGARDSGFGIPLPRFCSQCIESL